MHAAAAAAQVAAKAAAKAAAAARTEAKKAAAAQVAISPRPEMAISRPEMAISRPEMAISLFIAERKRALSKEPCFQRGSALSAKAKGDTHSGLLHARCLAEWREPPSALTLP
jgi:hypothetical protein